MSPPGRLLALDWGERRIGLALSDETQTLATPAGALERRPGRRIPLRPIRDLVAAHGVVGVVVGLPLAPDGTEGAAARAARAFGALVGHATGLPVTFVDERYSSVEAQRLHREAGRRGRLARADVDAAAAAVVLQGELDERKSGAEAGRR